MAKNKSKSRTVAGKSSRQAESVGSGRPSAKSGAASSKSAQAAKRSSNPDSGSRKAPGVKPAKPASNDILKGFKRTLLKAYLPKPQNKPK
jgi:hypothetical protein